MSDRLKGRVAIVTGSGQGHGKAIALEMAKEGAKVVTNNRRPGSTGLISRDPALEKLTKEQREYVLAEEARLNGDAETTAKEIRDMGGEAVAVFGNVVDYDVASNLIKTAVDKFGKVDIMVNNAGTFQASPIWAMTPETWHKIVDPHLDGTWNCTRLVAPLMKEQKWGRIINAISTAFLGSKYNCNYSAAKGGIVSLTRSVAKDLWEFGVTCNAYSPNANTRASLSLLIHSMLGSRTGGGRMNSWKDGLATYMRPGSETISPFITYLATEEAAYISGSIFWLGSSPITHYGLYSEPEEIATLDRKKGLWTVDELIKEVPKTFLKGYKSKAPL